MSRHKKDAVISKVMKVGGQKIQPGMRAHVDIPVARLSTGDWLSLPIEVLNGIHPGPRLWLSGAIHGDEVVGVAISHRVLQALDPLHHLLLHQSTQCYHPLVLTPTTSTSLPVGPTRN